MTRLTAILTLAIGLVLPSNASAQDPVSVGQAAQIMYWWITEGGPKMQKMLPGKGFQAAEKSKTIYIANNTDQVVKFYLESANCDKKKYTLEPGDRFDTYCQTTEGDKWYNIYFGKTAYGVDGGSLQVFEYDSMGQLDLIDYTEQAMNLAK